MDVAKRHQLNIARRTLKLNDVFARVMGGMTKDEARRIVAEHAAKRKGGRTSQHYRETSE